MGRKLGRRSARLQGTGYGKLVEKRARHMDDCPICKNALTIGGLERCSVYVRFTAEMDAIWEKG